MEFKMQLKNYMNEIYKESNYSMETKTIFKDIIIIGALESASVFKPLDSDDMEELISIKAKYNKTQSKLIGNVLGLIYNNLNDNPRDIIGEMYMTLGFANKKNGQFFTPYNISKMMAAMMLGEVHKKADKQEKPLSICDPCVGAGGMLIAAGELLIGNGVDKDRFILVGQDIDIMCARMAFLQLTYLGCRCQITCGNSLLNKGGKIYSNIVNISFDLGA